MNIREFLQDNNIPIASEGHDHYRPGWVNIDCPFCGQISHYRLGYNLAYGYMNCWQCGNVRLFEALAAILPDYPRKDLVDFVKGVDRERTVLTRPRGKLKLPSGLGPLSSMQKDYLSGRKFKWRELKQVWGIQGCGPFAQSQEGVDLKFRIFIPIVYHGQVVSWTTRSTSDEHKLRYISASMSEESMDHKSILYGSDYVRHTAIICEGPTDVWRIGPGAVCTFGTAYRTAQLGLLAAFPVRVVCYDSDPNAQRKARKLCDLLSVYDGRTYNVVLDSKDPGSGTASEIRRIRETFLNVSL